eukprot:gene34738-42846_t
MSLLTLKYDKYLTTVKELSGSVKLREDRLQEMFIVYHQNVQVIEELRAVNEEEVVQAEVVVLSSSRHSGGVEEVEVDETILHPVPLQRLPSNLQIVEADLTMSAIDERT